MGKRIKDLTTTSSPANDDYLPVDSANSGTRKIYASLITGKQDAIIAGTNITIAADGKTISATDTTYSAGTNVQIDDGVISATDTTYIAGTNVQINNNIISATDTTYSAFTGATSGADGSSGLVPQPLIADKDKFLKSDGSWDTIQPGASALDDLTNVDITSPTNGQVLKYDSTNQEWVNANESGGGGGSTVTITPTLSTGTKIADYSIDGSTGALFAPNGSGGASALSDLTDVTLTSPTNGQALVYDATNQIWVNGDVSGGGGTAHRVYLGELCPRVTAQDSHITASSEGSYGQAVWYPWGAFSSTPITNWSIPQTGSAWVDRSDSTPWIMYHFDEPRYFTQITISCGSNYSSAYSGSIYIEASNDGTTWTDIGNGSNSINAPLQSINDNTYQLDDTNTWEYIRVKGAQSFFIANSPSCFMQSIQVYGGKISTVDVTDIDFSDMTGSQTIDVMNKLNSGIANSTSGTFTTGNEQYAKVEVNCGFRPTYIRAILPFSNGDTYATYDADISTTQSSWYIPMESRTYSIDIGSETGETGITDITDTGFKFRCNAPNTRNVQCTFSARVSGQTYIQTVDFTDLTQSQIADLKTILGIE